MRFRKKIKQLFKICLQISDKSLLRSISESEHDNILELMEAGFNKKHDSV